MGNRPAMGVGIGIAGGSVDLDRQQQVMPGFAGAAFQQERAGRTVVTRVQRVGTRTTQHGG